MFLSVHRYRTHLYVCIPVHICIHTNHTHSYLHTHTNTNTHSYVCAQTTHAPMCTQITYISVHKPQTLIFTQITHIHICTYIYGDTDRTYSHRHIDHPLSCLYTDHRHPYLCALLSAPRPYTFMFASISQYSYIHIQITNVRACTRWSHTRLSAGTDHTCSCFIQRYTHSCSCLRACRQLRCARISITNLFPKDMHTCPFLGTSWSWSSSLTPSQAALQVTNICWEPLFAKNQD